MAHENRFITSTGTSIYFAAGGANPAVAWNGSSPTTPWTSQSTTPFEIGMNDVTGQRWLPVEASATTAFAGRSLIPVSYLSYPNVDDPMPIQIRGTTQDAMIAALRLLRQELRTASYSKPARLALKPDGQTNVAYSEIYKVDVAINPLFINDENGVQVLRAVLLLTRAPFFSNSASGATALTSGSHTNQAGSNTRNLPTTPSGDLTYEGQPMNIHLVGTGTNKYMKRLMLSSVAGLDSSTTGAGVLSGASTSTPKATIAFASGGSPDLFDAITGNERTRLRVIMRFSSVTANSVVQIWIPGVGYSGRITLAAMDRVVDFGDFLPEPQRWRTSPLIIYLYLISGGPITLVNTEALAYYEFAMINSFINWESSAGGAPAGYDYVDVNGFRETTNRATLPLFGPTLTYFAYNATYDFGPQPYYGTLPRLYPSTKLWLAWTTAAIATGLPDTTFTETMTTTATYAPLFLNFRGAQ
jgi:hypothetical protein